ncbi:MAG: hypothetical protein GYB67_11250, partial [Chloroflexi bacterium]|nr:hypothetical protein [Chloroflexota bacterium]
PIGDVDFVSYSINPQVHAFDNLSLIETLGAHIYTVETARSFCGQTPVIVGPVTFKMRRNPNATGPMPPTPPGELPETTDVRQMSLLGAGWTLGSLKYLAESGVVSVTYYKTEGLEGIMQSADGSPLPDKFPTLPGAKLYPMWQVFKAVTRFAGGEIIHSHASQPLRVDGLVLRKDNDLALLLANYTAQPQTVRIAGLAEGYRGFTGFTMDAETVLDNAIRADAYTPDQAFNLNGEGAISLPPYALVFLSGDVT